ncbi:fasciclin domain-containing protein [Granulosicoccus antarcticus]|uniref:Cell surface lipoprotein MPT83 n=1 Tax=Granulosicoccus antarcticus IMCC3135 TaxID=1192854 RepID=A0A2Z2P1Z7_9GAMM|nr:fasciclin domain-containing protein [Granulosicoccus antarcticus]ASJ76591.1 Cell surface lipoprotein MPT83 [Granulosicoccus antarcticus IMCC3135]
MMKLRPSLSYTLARSIRISTIAVLGLLVGACSSSDSSDNNNGGGDTDPATTEPGEVPVVDVEVVELETVEFIPPATATENLYETLVASGEFTRLLALYERAGISDSLKGSEAMTLFAPTDAAFDALDVAIGNGVLDSFTAAELADRLQYHAVLANALDSTALRDIDGQALEMANGLPAAFTINADGDLMINNATLTIPGSVGSNGIAYTIDTVLTPPVRVTDPNENIPAPTTDDISTFLLRQTNYSIMLNLIEQAGMTELLQEDNGGLGWTLFIAPNASFEQGEEDVFELDMNGAMELVQRHLYPGTLTTEQMQEGDLVMSSGSVSIVRDATTGLSVGGATIVGRDRVVGNGIIQFIDKPLVSTGS